MVWKNNNGRKWKTSANGPRGRRTGPMGGFCTPAVGTIGARSEIDGEAADVLPRHTVRIDRVEEVRRVRRARDLDAEEDLEVEQDVQRLGDADVHPLAAVVAAGAVLLRLAHLAVRHPQRRPGRLVRRLHVAGDEVLV